MVILRVGVSFLFQSQDSHLAPFSAAVLLGGRSFLRCLYGTGWPSASSPTHIDDHAGCRIRILALERIVNVISFQRR